MNGSLTGAQHEQFYKALLSAFPTAFALERMLFFKLGERLNQISGGNSLSERVFNLLQWAEAQGRMDDLINGAQAENLGNPELRMFIEQRDAALAAEVTAAPVGSLLGPTEPATVLIAYDPADEAAVAGFEQALQLRGLRVVRDSPQQALNLINVRALVERIKRGCDAAVVFLSPATHAAPVLTNHALPALRARQAHADNLPVIPILYGLTRADLQGDEALAWLDGQHPVVVADDLAEPGTWNTAAQQVLALALPRRLSRDDPPVPLTVCLRTFYYTPPATHLHLDLDWTALFLREASPAPDTWREGLLPALDDVKKALARQPQQAHGLNFWLKARLPVAVALGHTFPNRLGIPLYFHRADQVWDNSIPAVSRLEVALAETPPTITRPNAVGLVLEINRLIAGSVEEWQAAADFHPFRQVHGVAQPPSDRAITSERQAQEWAQQIRTAVLPWWNSPGVQELHLFMAGPVEFAAYVGQGLNERRPLYVYEWDASTTTYRVTCILDPPG